MKTEKLYKLADEQNITLDYFPLPQNKSLCVQMDDKYFIALDPLFFGSAAERVCLAHELGHCSTGSFYNLYSSLDVREKHENRADKWAINVLIPEKELNKAIKHGCRDISSLAEHFCVTEDFVDKALKLYGKFKTN